jgi:hypothetical protein
MKDKALQLARRPSSRWKTSEGKLVRDSRNKNKHATTKGLKHRQHSFFNLPWKELVFVSRSHDLAFYHQSLQFQRNLLLLPAVFVFQ